MARQGNDGYSYRLLYDPLQDKCLATPVASTQRARTGVIAPRG